MDDNEKKTEYKEIFSMFYEIVSIKRGYTEHQKSMYNQ